MTGQTNNLVERLRRETSERLQYVAQTIRCLVNPDGPEAADHIEALSAHIAVLEGELEAAYREGHCDGGFLVISGEFSTEEIDWQKSLARRYASEFLSGQSLRLALADIEAASITKEGTTNVG